MIQTLHIATRRNGLGERIRYSHVMTDHEFKSIVQDLLAEYGVEGVSGWMFAHIPQDEYDLGSARLSYMMSLQETTCDIEDDLREDILRQATNHNPCEWCAERTDAPPRGSLCTGWIPSSPVRDRTTWRGYLCDQCSDEIEGLRWLDE